MAKKLSAVDMMTELVQDPRALMAHHAIWGRAPKKDGDDVWVTWLSGFPKPTIFWGKLGGIKLTPEYREEIGQDERVQGLYSFIKSNPSESSPAEWVAAYKEFLGPLSRIAETVDWRRKNDVGHPGQKEFLSDVGKVLDLMIQSRRLGLPEDSAEVSEACHLLTEVVVSVKATADWQELPEWKLEEGRVYIRELEDAIYARVPRGLFLVSDVLGA